MTRRRVLAALFTGLLAGLSATAHASEACHRRGDELGWYVPDHARVQTGGYLGFLTIGAGYEAFEILDVDLFYGFVPEAVGGTAVHTPALRVSAHVTGACLTPELNFVYLRGGVGVLMAFGEGFLFASPERFRRGYYPVTALRGFFMLGSALEWKQPEGSPFASHGAFVELTALDQYLALWLENPKTVSALDAVSLSLGYVAGF